MASLHSGLRVLAAWGLVAASMLLGASSALFGVCGPFTDVAADAFCPFVLEVFYLGVTTGTTPTTYDPTSPVSRLQMAAFLSRTVDGTLKRASLRAAADKFWTPQTTAAFVVTTLGSGPYGRERVLITNNLSNTVSLWKAADLSALGSPSLALNNPGLATSDGLNFWITFPGTTRIQRF